MKNIMIAIRISTCVFLGAMMVSCSNFLDVKQSKSQIQVKTLHDLQRLLDNVAGINLGSTGMLEVGTDDYVVEDSRFGSLTPSEQEIYIWKPEILYEGTSLQGWSLMFSALYILNSVQEELAYAVDKHTPEAGMIRGTVLFWRSLYQFQGAEVFCMPYVKGASNDSFGFPMKYSADFFEKVSRGTVQQTYDEILSEMKEALELLPETTLYKSRPSKTSAHAALARIYLVMQDYEQAHFHANEALNRFSTLLDFNQLHNLTVNIPFTRDNGQVILYATANGLAGLQHANRNSYVPGELYDQYEEGDLRKIAYFFDRGAGKFSFKARYSLSLASQFFTGFATDELYLIRAECLARSGKTEGALADLNHLLRHRWESSKFVPLTATGADEALRIILRERRKELLTRGLRWSDLRRLNLDPRFAQTLTRTIVIDNQQKEYRLLPNDLRYAYPIPHTEVDALGIEQNPR